MAGETKVDTGAEQNVVKAATTEQPTTPNKLRLPYTVRELWRKVSTWMRQSKPDEALQEIVASPIVLGIENSKNTRSQPEQGLSSEIILSEKHPAKIDRIPPEYIKPEDFDPEKAKRGIRELQDFKIDLSLQEILSKMPEGEALRKIKKWTTYGPRELADALLLGSVVGPIQRSGATSKESFQVREKMNEVGLKFYLSHLRVFLQEAAPGIETLGDSPSARKRIDELFTDIAEQNPLDNLKKIVSEASEIYSLIQPITDYKRQYKQAGAIIHSLGNALQSGDTVAVGIEVNRLKGLNHWSGLFYELTTNDLVGSCYVDSLSRCKGISGNLFATFASEDTRVMVGKIMQRDPTLHPLRDQLFRQYLDEKSFFNYWEGPWRQIEDQINENRANQEPHYLSTTLMAPSDVAAQMHQNQMTRAGGAFYNPDHRASVIWRHGEEYIKRILYWKMNQDKPENIRRLHQIEQTYRQPTVA